VAWQVTSLRIEVVSGLSSASVPAATCRDGFLPSRYHRRKSFRPDAEPGDTYCRARRIGLTWWRVASVTPIDFVHLVDTPLLVATTITLHWTATVILLWLINTIRGPWRSGASTSRGIQRLWRRWLLRFWRYMWRRLPYFITREDASRPPYCRPFFPLFPIRL